MKAREWLDRGRREREPIEAFSDFWRGFNNLFAAPKGTERETIKAYLTANLSPDQASQILLAHPAEVGYLLSQPVIDMKSKRRDTSASVQAFHAAHSDCEKLIELFMVIYQVRCNLEHGQKSPNRARDIELCRCAAPIVSNVVQLLA